MQHCATIGVGKRLDEVKLFLPIDVSHKCGDLVDVNGIANSIRRNCLCEVTLKLNVNREFVTCLALFFIHAMKTANAEIIYQQTSP
jgi:hypothetical protein